MCRNDKGEMVSGSTSALFAIDVLTADALAMREALTLASCLNLSSVLMEYDNMILMETCRGKLVRRGIEQIIEDIQRLKLNFTLIGFPWTKRDGNKVADLIAKMGATGDLQGSWALKPMALNLALIEDAPVTSL